MKDVSNDNPRGVHLVGSIPLGDAENVFRTTADVLGTRLRRVTDGETGGRLDWIVWQLHRLMQHDQFEVVPPGPRNYAPNPLLAVKDGIALEDVRFGSLGYADEARPSWETFSRLQADGVLPASWRFQVSLPTPLAPIEAFVLPDEKVTLEPLYEDAMRREVDEIASFVPHESLAIQWDTAVEFGILEGVFPPFYPGDAEEGVVSRLARYAGWVPDDVQLGFHYCYGDADHEHFKQPADASLLVRIANRVSEEVDRQIQWIHMPVPRDRDDDQYFAPLADLALHDETDLYLGLVHMTDGVEGTLRRIATAQRVAPAFGVATECGMGRRQPETIPALLKIHAEVADPVV
jgi:hypothetical protein